MKNKSKFYRNFLLKLDVLAKVAPLAIVAASLATAMLLAVDKVDNPKRYFSPNLDGSKDVFPVPLVIKERSLDKWIVDILQKNGSQYDVVRHFESLNTREVKTLTAKKFFQRLIERDSSVDVPSLVQWSGEDDKGKLMQDGEYFLSIYARDRSGNETKTPLIPIYIDTVAPISSFKLSDTIFSPNEDGNKEKLTVDVSSENFEALDLWQIDVLNENGDVVHSRSSRKAKDSWQWNGKDENNKDITQGRYLLRITSSDYAGNSSVSEQQSFTLVRSYEKANLAVSPRKISPNGDSFFDTATFTPSLSKLQGLQEWKIELSSKSGEKLRTYKGNSQLPTQIVFDGRRDDGKIIDDGQLVVRFSSEFRSGNTPSSKDLQLIVDNTPPQLSLGKQTKTFNPTAASGATTLEISQQTRGDGDESYVGLVEDAEKRVVLETNFGKSLPEKFIWNGENKFKKRVAGNYRYVLVGRDSVANISTTSSRSFKMVLGDIAGRLSSSRLAFSPNGDEIKDLSVFLLDFEKSYQEILKKGSIVVTKDAKGTQEVRSFKLEKFTPETVWDGLDNSGNALPNGEYFFKGDFEFSTGESISFEPQAIYLDTVPIVGTYTPVNDSFSPNSDGRLDEYEVKNFVKQSEILPNYDMFVVRIETAEGDLIRENAWTKDLPKTIRWNGKDQAGKTVAQGVYRYRVISEDEAGNRSEFSSKPINLVLKAGELELQTSSPVVSGNTNASVTNMVFSATSAERSRPIKFTYSLLNDAGQEFLLHRSEQLQDFKWDLVAYEKSKIAEKKAENKNFYLASGDYFVYAQAEYDSGVVATSKKVPLLIDNEFPENGIGSRPQYFSPDNDGENEQLSLRFLATDNDRIVKNSAVLFRKVEIDKKGKIFAQDYANYANNFPIFQSFEVPTGTAIDKTFVWNGIGKDGSLVESANDYVVFFTSTDRVGLSTQSFEPILIDIFIERLADGRLKIVINSINFKYNSDKMIGDYQSVLARLVRMLAKFPNYEILITGHTDSRGKDNYNQNLSVKRAKRVFNFLTKTAGIPKKQIKYEGRGERELFIKEEVITDPTIDPLEREYLTEENYRKNRRVEFFLEKEEKGN